MKEQWIVATKRADFYGIAQQLQVDPVVIRLMRNRDIKTAEEMERWLHPSLEQLHNSHQLKHMDEAVELILQHIQKKNRIMVANDFDCDGISSGYILEHGLKRIGANIYVDTPDRCKDGYGLNERLVEEAYHKDVKLIITCDNGIAAFEAVALARKLGMDVIITDHHEVAYTEDEKGQRTLLLPQANYIIDPKQPDCTYPFEGICGAVVAWKCIQVIYEKVRLPESTYLDYLEIAAMATVADVMELRDENRSIVSLGLNQMKHTKNLGLQALIQENHIAPESLTAYHIGFVIGPCLNASGRLDTAKVALELLNAENTAKAHEIASYLKDLNDSRKSMTVKGTMQAIEKIEQSSLKNDKVLIVELEDCHESLVGIIAGRLKEKYHRPVIVLTNTEAGMKGSGRSIPAYDIFAQVNQFRSILLRFGGHPMACGLTIAKENVAQFRRGLNENTKLTDKDLMPVVSIDMEMPVEYASEGLIQQFTCLEPFGNGNRRPLFAQKGFAVEQLSILGKNRNVLKLCLRSPHGQVIVGMYFGDIEDFQNQLVAVFGQGAWVAVQRGLANPVKLMICYYPEMNEFRGIRSLQIVIQNYEFME